jgi:hypothetical protein
MDEINLAQYSSASQRFWAIFAFHQMSESAKSPNSLRLLIETAFFTSLSVDSSWQIVPHGQLQTAPGHRDRAVSTLIEATSMPTRPMRPMVSK